MAHGRTMSGADPAAEPEPVTGVTADEAISALYRSHRLAMLRLATLLIDDRGIAEEIVQDAFGALYRRWDALADTSAAAAYLRASVVNGARNERRRRDVARRHLGVAARPTDPAPDFAMLLAEEHRQVITALRTLPPRQREVLVLRYWSDLGEADIAAAMGISRGTVKSTASRALRALENALKETP